MRYELAAFALALLISPAARAQPGDDPFAFLEPSIQFSARDYRRLDERGIVVKILPADGHELAVLAAASISVDPAGFIAAIGEIAELKRGSLVPQIGRFSMPPRPEDLQELTLDAVDIDEIRRCRPEHCGLKLMPQEIGRLQQVLAAGAATGDAHAALDTEFRRIVVQRATTYERDGDDAGEQQFWSLLQHSPYIASRMPRLAAYFEDYPRVELPGAQSFLYWSKETYAWRPMITLTHAVIVRGSGAAGTPDVLVASRDVFSTRYTSGSFVLTMLFRDPASASKHYLVYVNRTWVDGLHALWRPFVEHGIKAQAGKVFAGARERIEQMALRTAASRSR